MGIDDIIESIFLKYTRNGCYIYGVFVNSSLFFVA